jgi:uncharacterized protein (TIGR03067 family)
MIRLLTLLAALGFAATAVADEKTGGADKLEGLYTIVSGEEDGKPVPAKHLEGSVLQFKDGQVIGTDKNEKQFFAAKYKLVTSAKPYRISMVSETPVPGTKSEGIIEVDGDTVKLCYNLPGGAVPTSFKTKEKQHCFTLKRLEKK